MKENVSEEIDKLTVNGEHPKQKEKISKFFYFGVLTVDRQITNHPSNYYHQDTSETTRKDEAKPREKTTSRCTRKLDCTLLCAARGYTAQLQRIPDCCPIMLTRHREQS